MKKYAKFTNFQLYCIRSNSKNKDKDAEATVERAEYYFQDLDVKLKFASETGEFNLKSVILD